MSPQMWTSLGFSAAVVAVSVALTRWNESSWRRFQNQEDVDSQENVYLRRRYRRRKQTNILLGCIGIALFVGSMITEKWTFVVFWCCVLLAVLWVLLLGLLDALDTRMHYRGLKDQYRQQQELLRREVDAFYEAKKETTTEDDDA